MKRRPFVSAEFIHPRFAFVQGDEGIPQIDEVTERANIRNQALAMSRNADTLFGDRLLDHGEHVVLVDRRIDRAREGVARCPCCLVDRVLCDALLH